MYTEEELRIIARSIAALHNIDPALVCAICEHESAGWNPYAIRFEPVFLVHYVHPGNIEAPKTIEVGRAMSWGLMQIMGLTAEELGFKAVFPNYHALLLEPTVGVEYGCKKLKNCLTRHDGDVVGALLAYNGGGDKTYPNKVIKLIGKYVLNDTGRTVGRPEDVAGSGGRDKTGGS